MSDPVDPAPETTAAPLTLGQRLAAKLAGLEPAAALQSQLNAANAELTTLRTQNEALANDLSAANVAIATVTADRDAARASLETAETAVADFETRVNAASVARCASVGVPEEQLPVTGGAGEGTRKAVKTIEDSAAFYNARFKALGISPSSN